MTSQDNDDLIKMVSEKWKNRSVQLPPTHYELQYFWVKHKLCQRRQKVVDVNCWHMVQ